VYLLLVEQTFFYKESGAIHGRSKRITAWRCTGFFGKHVHQIKLWDLVVIGPEFVGSGCFATLGSSFQETPGPFLSDPITMPEEPLFRD